MVLALAIALMLAAGLGAGLYFDDRLGTRPIATLVCSLVAAHIAFALVFRRFATALREIDRAGDGRHNNREDTEGAT